LEVKTHNYASLQIQKLSEPLITQITQIKFHRHWERSVAIYKWFASLCSQRQEKIISENLCNLRNLWFRQENNLLNHDSSKIKKIAKISFYGCLAELVSASHHKNQETLKQVQGDG